MNYPSAALAYRKASVQQDSPAALAIALLDMLAADLHTAIAAIGSNAIEKRSNALKHGFRVLTQLNAQVDRAGGHAAESSLRFYEYLRVSMLAAQFQSNAPILIAAARHIVQVRSAWQQVAERTQRPAETTPPGRGADSFEPSSFNYVA